jgi:hypothetical protein
MALQIQGNGGTVAEVQGTTFRSVTVSPKPLEYTTFGHYSWGALSGVVPAALAANSEILQFQWTDASRVCVINKITMSAAVTTTFFAAGVPLQFALLKATAWTAVGTGGTRPAVAAQLKKRTSMGSSLLAANNIGVITTAALGAGTKTLETTPMVSWLAAGPITASLYGPIISAQTVLFKSETGDGGHPLALVQNEGFVVTAVAVPATGTWQCAFTVEWAEVATY